MKRQKKSPREEKLESYTNERLCVKELLKKLEGEKPSLMYSVLIFEKRKLKSTKC